MFFPANLVFFLMGSLAYHGYDWIRGKRIARWLGPGAAALIVAWTVSPPLWTAPDLDQPLCWAFYMCVWICTPLLFNLTRTWKVDNFVGQLSYPVYLAHIPMIEIARSLRNANVDRGLLALVLTLAVSAALYAFIDRPIERIRRRIGAA